LRFLRAIIALFVVDKMYLSTASMRYWMTRCERGR